MSSDQVVASNGNSMVSFTYKYITKAEDLPAIAQEIASAQVLSEDLETTGFSPILNNIRLWSINTGKNAYVIDVFKTGRPDCIIQAHKDNPDAIITGQNLKFDQGFLLYHYGLELLRPFDCFRASNLMWNGRNNVGHNLWDLYRRELNINPQTQDLGGSDWSAGELTLDQLDYAAEDVVHLPHLRDALKPKLTQLGLNTVAGIEFQAILAESAVELNGFYLDPKAWRELAAQNLIKRNTMESVLWDELPDPDNQLTLPGLRAQWNLDSPKQMLAALRQLGVTQRVRDEETGKEKVVPLQDTSEITLAMAADEFPQIAHILEYREAATQIKMFGPEFLEFVNPVTHRVHPSYYPFLISGRYGCARPNLSQIPRDKRFRKCFRAEEGNTLVIADYSNIEMRIVAEISGDEVLIKVFVDGKDAHRFTAAILTNKPEDQVTKPERQQAKPVNFGFIYGMQPPKLVLYARANYGVHLTHKQAVQFREKYFERFAGVARWHNRAQRDGQRQKMARSIGGRLRYLEGEFFNEFYNHPVQACLQGHSQVLTDKGYQAIESLVGADVSKLKVWTGTVWAPFVARAMGEHPLATVELADGTRVDCDQNHKFLAVTSQGYEWREFSALREGDEVALALPKPLDWASPPLPVPPEPFGTGKPMGLSGASKEDLWWLIGYYYGNGHILATRGTLSFAVGLHRRYYADRLRATLFALGLNPSVRETTRPLPSGKTGRCLQVSVTSRVLEGWLALLGITQSDAHHKRLTSFIFQLGLADRAAFAQGFLAADGQLKPADGNPVNLHLCQRPLLEDMKLLLHTCGIRSTVRGPYERKGSVSYRLDIPVSDWALLTGEPRRHPKASAPAPDFLLKAVRAAGLRATPTVFSSMSDYVVYRRILSGGSTTVTTLARLAGALGLDVGPIYGSTSVKTITRHSTTAPTYTLTVDDPLHRFDAQGVITKNSGADGLKNSLRKVYNRFKKLIGRPPTRIKDLPDPTVKMIHHVHDEVVSESKDDKELVEQVKHEQEEGMKEGMRPFLPRVPVDVEASAGYTWADKS